MSLIFDLIKDANKEYDKNGRSEAFVKMERKMLSAKRAMTLYFFARYVKGVDTKKFQNKIIGLGDLEVGFYFLQYIPNADFQAFLDCAVENRDKFWAEHYIQLLEKEEGRSHITNSLRQEVIARGLEISPVSQIVKIDNIMAEAPKEFKKNGVSPKFIEMENEVIHSIGTGNLSLFLSKHNDMLNMKKVERSLTMRGDADTIYLFSKMQPKISKSNMILALELAKYDYIKLEENTKGIENKLAILKSRLRVAIKKGCPTIAIENQIIDLENELSYDDKIDVYIFQLRQDMYKK